jgi:hypothetical protein
MSLMDILKQYAGTTSPSGDVTGHFDAVAAQSHPDALGSGVAAAMRSDATPPFGDTIGKLFNHSDPSQKAGLLNEMMQALGPSGLAGAGGGILGRILGPGAASTNTPITPAQASQLSPSDVGTLASAAQQQNGSIVDKLGSFYAQHPALVKTLGVAAMAVAMSHMNSQQKA